MRQLLRFIFFSPLFLSFHLFSQNWGLELSSTVEYRTWKLSTKAEKEEKGVAGAVVALTQGGKVVKQVNTDANGDFVIQVPPNGEYVLTISYKDCNPKKVAVSTKGVPPEVGDDKFTPTYPMSGVIMAKAFPGIDYSAIQNPIVKIQYFPKGKLFDKDESYTDNMFSQLKKINDAENDLIEKFCKTNKEGDAALKKPDCPLAKKLYGDALNLIPAEWYPTEQLKKVGDCLKEKEDAEKKIADAAANKAKAEADAKAKSEQEAVAKKQAEEAKAKADADNKAKAEAEKVAKEKVEAEIKAKAEAEKIAKDKSDAETKSKGEAEAKLKEKADAEAKSKAEADKVAVAAKAEAENKAKAEADKLAKEKADTESKAKAEAEKLAAQKAEADKAVASKADADNKAKAEADKQAKLIADQAKADADKKVVEVPAETKTVAPVVDEQKIAAEKAAATKAEAEKQAKILADQAAAQKAKAAEKAAALAVAREKAAAAKAERDKAAAEKVAKEKEAPKVAETPTVAVATKTADGNFDPEKKQGAQTFAAPSEEDKKKVGIYNPEYSDVKVTAKKKEVPVPQTVFGKDQYKEVINRADDLYKMQRYAEAKTIYEQALKLRPDDAYAKSKLEQVEKLIQAK